MYKGVLFVCLGNICRSPMAEAVFRHMVKSRGGFADTLIDSCGTGGWHSGEPPHVGTQEVLRRNQISFEGQTARKLHRDDFHRFDLIVPMDLDNRSEVLKFAKSEGISKPNVELLMSFAKNLGVEEVPDPYYNGKFDYVFELVTAGCEGILESMHR